MDQSPRQPEGSLDLGAWIGRQQAFAVLANKCSAAQALALKQMKDSATHLQLGLTWVEFCPRHLGISSRQANRIIAQYEEFGEAYFRLSTLARITAEDYRALSPSIDEDSLEIDGERVPIAPENAFRIRAFVRSQRSHRPASSPEPLAAFLIRAKARHRELIEAVCRRVRAGLPESQRKAWNDLLLAVVDDWHAIDRIVNEAH